MTERKEWTQQCGNYVQVLEVARKGMQTMVIVNVYDQQKEGERPAQRAEWGKILGTPRVVIAGDMNAHSGVWNPRLKRRRNATFWEDLIKDHEMVV